jgi:hypothetical protein
MGRSLTVEQGGMNGAEVDDSQLSLGGAQAHLLLEFFHDKEAEVSGMDKVAERLRRAAFETLFTAFTNETLSAYLRQELKGVVDITTPVITIPSRPTFSPEAQVVEVTLGNRMAQEQAFTVCFVQIDAFSCVYVFPWAGPADNS